MFSKAPVAFRCTRISLDLASRVRGTKAPDLAIWVLFSSNESATVYGLYIGPLSLP